MLEKGSSQEFYLGEIVVFGNYSYGTVSGARQKHNGRWSYEVMFENDFGQIVRDLFDDFELDHIASRKNVCVVDGPYWTKYVVQTEDV